MKVVEYEDQRIRVGNPDKQRRDGVEQPKLFALGGFDEARRRLSWVPGEVRQKPPEGLAMRAQMEPQLVRRTLGNVVAQCDHERLIRDQRVLVAAPEQYRSAVRIGSAGEFRRQPGLANPRLADQHRDATASSTGALPVSPQLRERQIASDDRCRA